MSPKKFFSAVFDVIYERVDFNARVLFRVEDKK